MYSVVPSIVLVWLARRSEKDSAISGSLADVPTASQSDSYDKLTERERQILQLLVEGFGVREIAEKLFISTKTVGAHRANLMDKLEVGNMVDLVKYALRKGVIRLE